jgi:hypothetical protein
MASKKTKSSATTAMNATTSGTTTPDAPSWVTGLSEQFAGQIPNTGFTATGASGLQNDAFGSLSGQNFGGMFGDAASMFKSAGGSERPRVSEGDALQGVDKWLSPYLSQVVDATSNDLTENEGRVRSMQDLSMARNNAFGGSGSAITQSMTEGELARARASTLGGLRQDGFNSAAQLSQAEESRKLQARIAEAQAAAAASAMQLQAGQGLAGLGQTGIGLQADLGATQQGLNQQVANQPLTELAQQIGLFGQLPADLLTGQSTTGNVNQTGSSTGKSSSFGVDYGSLLFGVPMGA